MSMEEQNKEQVLGGWSEFKCISDDENCVSKDIRKIFENAMKKVIGVDYYPFAYSEQVVAGMNYRILCNATLPSPIPRKTLVIVYIHVSLEGEAEVYDIKECC